MLQVGIPGLHDELGRAHHVGAIGPEHHRRPLVGGGEGHGALHLPQGGLGEPLGHGPGGVVVRIDGPVVGVEDLLHLPGGTAVLVQGDDLLHRHLGLGDGACLVHTQHVHMGQRLHGGQLVDQGLLLGQPHDGHRQGHAGEQVQPLGDHADEGGHHRGHRLGELIALDHQLVVEQGRANGDEGEADEPDQPVQRLHHLGAAHPLVGLGLQGQAGGVAVRPHPVQPGPALAGHHKAAGQQLVPHVLGDGVGLAGDQGLVHRHLPGQHRAVGGDLVPRPQLHNVLPHQLVDGDGAQLPVPHHLHPGLADEGQLLQGGPGAELLDDADEGVDDGDAQEHHVLEVPGQHQQGRQHHKDQVEEGEGVLPDDLPGGLGVGGHRLVAHALLQKLGGLGGGESGFGVGENPLRLPGRAGGPFLPAACPLFFLPPAPGGRGLLCLRRLSHRKAPFCISLGNHGISYHRKGLA